VQRLLIVAPNWLGDAVMALPAIADVRRALPGASITIAARPAIAPLFAMVPGVNDVMAFEKGGGNLSHWSNGGVRSDNQTRDAGFDLALLLPNSFHSALIVARAGIRQRWGYRTDCRGLLLTRGVRRAPAGVHQVEYYQQLVHALDFPNGPPTPHLEVSPGLRDLGAAALRSAGWDGRTSIVALAPGAAYGPAKRWPPAFFADLAVELAREGVATAMVGSAADARTAAEVVQAVGGRAALVNLVGKTDLTTLAGTLANCRMLATNDSGAMHLAAALGVSVIAMFGPTNEHATAPIASDERSTLHDRHTTAFEPPVANRDPGQRIAVLTHPVWCRPCMLRECPLDHACMRGIGTGTVLEAARRVL